MCRLDFGPLARTAALNEHTTRLFNRSVSETAAYENKNRGLEMQENLFIGFDTFWSFLHILGIVIHGRLGNPVLLKKIYNYGRAHPCSGVAS